MLMFSEEKNLIELEIGFLNDPLPGAYLSPHKPIFIPPLRAPPFPHHSI